MYNRRRRGAQAVNHVTSPILCTREKRKHWTGRVLVYPSIKECLVQIIRQGASARLWRLRSWRRGRYSNERHSVDNDLLVDSGLYTNPDQCNRIQCLSFEDGLASS